MCGRFTATAAFDVLADRFGITVEPGTDEELTARYNILADADRTDHRQQVGDASSARCEWAATCHGEVGLSACMGEGWQARADQRPCGDGSDEWLVRLGSQGRAVPCPGYGRLRVETGARAEA
jgi:hypothetical protein